MADEPERRTVQMSATLAGKAKLGIRAENPENEKEDEVDNGEE